MAVGVSYQRGRNLIAVKVEGVEQIVARLEKMEEHLRYRLLVDVMKKSLQKALLEAQARAPMGGDYWTKDPKKASPGRLKRSFRIKKMRNNNPFILEVQLQNTAYYALWVEYGHRIVKGGKKKKGRVVGQTGARPFMRPTYESQKDAIEAQVAAEVKAALTRRGL